MSLGLWLIYIQIATVLYGLRGAFPLIRGPKHEGESRWLDSLVEDDDEMDKVSKDFLDIRHTMQAAFGGLGDSHLVIIIRATSLLMFMASLVALVTPMILLIEGLFYTSLFTFGFIVILTRGRLSKGYTAILLTQVPYLTATILVILGVL